MADKKNERSATELPVPETMRIAALLAELMPSGGLAGGAKEAVIKVEKEEAASHPMIELPPPLPVAKLAPQSADPLPPVPPTPEAVAAPRANAPTAAAPLTVSVMPEATPRSKTAVAPATAMPKLAPPVRPPSRGEIKLEAEPIRPPSKAEIKLEPAPVRPPSKAEIRLEPPPLRPLSNAEIRLEQQPPVAKPVAEAPAAAKPASEPEIKKAAPLPVKQEPPKANAPAPIKQEPPKTAPVKQEPPKAATPAPPRQEPPRAAAPATHERPKAATQAAKDDELIPLGDLSVGGYFSLVNWRNDRQKAKHPRRSDYGLDEQTLALARRNPFYLVGRPRVPEARSVAAVLSEIAWD